MANREELLIIRSARAGHPQAQLALGKRYLFGSTNLPQSHPTALHWLEKAAEQNQQEAWMLIGEHVSYAVALEAEDPLRVALWYERAFEGKSARAGLVFAMLVFSCWLRADDGLRQKSMRALTGAAARTARAAERRSAAGDSADQQATKSDHRVSDQSGAGRYRRCAIRHGGLLVAAGRGK
jgi:hypothetical protein